MTPELPPSPKPPFAQRMGTAFVNFLRTLVRLILLVLILGLLGAGLYFGLPWLYNQYVAPLQENTRRIDELEARQEQANFQLTQAVGAAQGRLATLEIQSTSDGVAHTAALATLQARLDETRTALQSRLDTSETSLKEVTERLTAIDALLKEVDRSTGQLAATADANRAGLWALATEANSFHAPVAALQRDLQLVKAMELLTRSRIFLSQDNLGLAQQDILDARNVLEMLKSSTLPFQQEALNRIVSRLDLALDNLPGIPTLAADDLEVAWQLLVRGLPQTPLISTETPTPGVTSTPTSAKTPALFASTPVPTATGVVLPETPNASPAPSSTPFTPTPYP